MFKEKPLPRRLWRNAGIVVAFVLLTVVVVVLGNHLQSNWPIGIIFLVAGPVGYYFFGFGIVPSAADVFVIVKISLAAQRSFEASDAASNVRSIGIQAFAETRVTTLTS